MRRITCALAAVLMLSACTSAPPEGESTQAATNSSNSAPSTPTSDSTSTADAAPYDADAILQRELDTSWEVVLQSSPNAVRPDIDRIRLVDRDEAASVIVGCMHDLGWPDTKATPDGGIESGEMQSAQSGAYSLAMYTCSAKYPVEAKYNAPFSDQQINTLYSYYVDELQPCIEGEGYDVPAAPSREAFLDSYNEPGRWNLYENVTVKMEKWYALMEKCPQWPEGLYD